MGSETFDEYTNWEGSTGYVTDDGWFVYSKTVKEERTKTVSNVLTLKRDAQKRVLYSDGTYEGTKDGNQFVYFELVDNTQTKPADSSMQPVVEKDDAGTNKLFEATSATRAAAGASPWATIPPSISGTRSSRPAWC